MDQKSVKESPRIRGFVFFAAPFVFPAVAIVSILISQEARGALLFSLVSVFMTTYIVKKWEQSTHGRLSDHVRHTVFLYIFLAILLISSYDILYLAVIPGSDQLAQEKMLTYEKQSADLALKQIVVLLTAITANLAGVFLFKRGAQDSVT